MNNVRKMERERKMRDNRKKGRGERIERKEDER